MPLVANVSSTRIRQLAHACELTAAAGLLGRPLEVDGTVVSGDRRGKTLGFPTANLRVDPHLLVPGFGIYAGAADGKRAAISIGVNPHYGGTERRIEAYLLDWEGDLYGDRLVLELWRKLRDERAFESEADLVGADRPGRRGDARGDPSGVDRKKLPAAGVFLSHGRRRQCHPHRARPLPRLQHELQQARRRRHGAREPGLPALRLPRLDRDHGPYGT